MATTFKNFLSNDIANTRTLLHESIPITGSIVSGTYAENNIKTYGHGMFSSVYDYPYLSSSANQIFDSTIGFASTAPLYGNWESGGSLFNKRVKLIDSSGSNGYYVDSPAGEYGVLYATTSVGTTSMVHGETGLADAIKPAAGLLYYQAGIAVLSGSIFNTTASGGLIKNIDTDADLGFELGQGLGIVGMSAATASTIEVMNTGLRQRIYNISYNNTTELNSTIYFCRIAHNDFNYSSNPTYLNGSKLRVKSRATDTPVTYITTVGLYSADNELLAVAKLSEPLRKDPTNEITLRVRLDY